MPISICIASFITTIILSISSIFLFAKAINYRIVLILCVVFFANLAIKYPYNGIFYGMEYEDAYVYLSNARFISENPNYWHEIENKYYTNGCAYGCLNQCYVSETHHGHLLGYPAILLLSINIFGYSAHLGSYVSLLFSSLTAVIIVLLAYAITQDYKFLFICSIIYMAMPIVNIYSTTTFSEIFSQFSIAVTILIFINYLRSDVFPSTIKSPKHLILFATIIISSILAITIKRENILVIIILPLSALAHMYLTKSPKVHNVYFKFITYTICCLPAILIWLYIFDVLSSNSVEEQHIGATSFSIGYIFRLLPSVVMMYLNFSWFSFSLVLFIIGLFFSFTRRIIVFFFIVFVTYLIAYTSHYRSHFFIFGEAADPAEMIRYAMNTIFIYSLIAGYGAYRLYKFIRKHISNKNLSFLRIFIYTITILTIFSSVYDTCIIRSLFLKYEANSRFIGINFIKNIEHAKRCIFIVKTPLAYQILANPNSIFYDYYLLGNSEYLLDLKRKINFGTDVYYIANRNPKQTVNLINPLKIYGLNTTVKKSDTHFIIYKVNQYNN